MTYILYICLAAPLLFMLFMVHRRSRLPIGFLLLGITLCLVASELNTILLHLLGNDYFYVTTSITPLTEEVLKALPILIFAVESPNHKEKFIAASFAVGVGFAIFENLIILVGSVGTVSLGWAIIRGFASGLLHSICTVFVGYGAGVLFRTGRPKLIVSGCFALLALSVTFHGIFNLYMETGHTLIAFFIPAVSYGVLCIMVATMRKKKRAAIKEIREQKNRFSAPAIEKEKKL